MSATTKREEEEDMAGLWAALLRPSGGLKPSDAALATLLPDIPGGADADGVESMMSTAASTPSSSPPPRQLIRETLGRLQEDQRARQAAERERRRGQRDETRALVRLAQLDALDGARVAAHAADAAKQRAVAVLREKLRACEDRYQADKKRLAGLADKKARHEAVQRAKAQRDLAAGPLRESLQQLGDRPTSAATDGDGRELRLPRIGSADGGLLAAKTSGKADFRVVMEEIRSVKRAKSEMLDPYAADLKLGRLWRSINEPERTLECFERAAQSLKDKHLCKIPPDMMDVVLEKQRRRQREALRVLFAHYLRLGRGSDAVDLMVQYLDLSLSTERAATVAQLERVLREQPYVEDSALATPDDVTSSILRSGSLGPLNDLRSRLLTEMLDASPSDPYLLEAVANMHVRRREFDRARELTTQLGALPAAQQRALFSSFAQLRARDLGRIHLRRAMWVVAAYVVFPLVCGVFFSFLAPDMGDRKAASSDSIASVAV